PVPLVRVTAEGVPRAGVVDIVTTPALNTGTPVEVLLLAPRPPAQVPNGVVKPVREVMLELAPALATVPHVKLPVLYCSAEAAVLHPVGSAIAAGEAAVPVTFANTVLAA